MVAEVPRNYYFFSRLPKKFYIIIQKKVNSIKKGTWYLVYIDNHKLNILSQVSLEIGATYLVEKVSPTSIKIINKKSKSSFESNSEKFSTVSIIS